MIKSAGGDAISLRADVSDSEDARAMVEQTVRAFGGLDVLYNNAGIEGESGFIAQLSEEAFDRVIAINLRGVWLGMKYGLPQDSRARRRRRDQHRVGRRASSGSRARPHTARPKPA